MRNLVLVGVLVLLVSCKSKADQAISDLSGLKDKMCACKDKACAEDVQKEFKEMGKKYKDDKSDPSEEDKKKFESLFKEDQDCRRTARRGGAPDASKKMAELKDKMCSCKDQACADKVNEEFTKWGQEMAKSSSPDDMPSPEDSKKMSEMATTYTDCMAKVAAAPK
jgi:predicted nuclease with TOPRIM domain